MHVNDSNNELLRLRSDIFRRSYLLNGVINIVRFPSLFVVRCP